MTRTDKTRFRIPFYGEWLWRFIPQPRWLRRWYYRKSFQWWGHPSNHHWKGWLMPSIGPSWRHYGGAKLSEGERDVWGGCYASQAEAKEQHGTR